MKKIYLLLVVLLIAWAMSSCTSSARITTNALPEIRVDLTDLELSEPRTAEVSAGYVLYIDWGHLLKTRVGSIQGSVYAMEPMRTPTPGNKTMQYAVYELLKANPGYDMVMYPQFEVVKRKPVIGIGAIYQKVSVKVTARLAKIKK